MGALVTLISNEATEFILPMAYASVLLLSYYGPNAELMGNIKSSNWHYAGIVDINDTIFWLAVMFLVDSLSTVVSTLLLQIFCNINIVKMRTDCISIFCNRPIMLSSSNFLGKEMSSRPFSKYRD